MSDVTGPPAGTDSPASPRSGPAGAPSHPLSPTGASLLAKLNGRSARVGLVGAGYAGLPVGLEFCRHNVPLLVYDLDASKVEALNQGRSYIRHIPSEEIATPLRAGLLKATTNPGDLRDVDAILICVPTPLDSNRQPDMSFVHAASATVSKHLRRGQLVSLESTTYPGTTEEVVLPLLEASGLRVGTDVFLVYSPERVDPGNPLFGVANTPKVVGGVTPACSQLGSALYGIVAKEIITVSSTRAAESAKLLENIYRCVNIALVNELKMLFQRMDIDIWEVIAASKTKPFGFQAFYPGPGLGGHCIPVDPFYLTWKAREFDMNTRFIELAGEINTAMPRYVMERIAAAMNDEGLPLRGSKVLVLGAAYKRDIDDMRESPALKIIDHLLDAGSDVSYHDPNIAEIATGREDVPSLRSVPLTAEVVARSACVVLLTDHSAVDYDLVAQHARLIIDTRNVFGGLKAKVVNA